MKIRYTKSLLTKLEELVSEMGYTVRYEKGAFNSGYCILRNEKIILINKFIDLEGRIQMVMNIIDEIEVQTSTLSKEGVELYLKLREKQTQALN